MTPDAALNRRCKGIRRARLVSFWPRHRTRQWTNVVPFGVINATNALMSKNHMHLRPLTHEDAQEFQRLRLQGLRDIPSSFGSSTKKKCPRPRTKFGSRSRVPSNGTCRQLHDAALRLYQAAGFMEVGRMPRALKVGPNYFDELMMVRNT